MSDYQLKNEASLLKLPRFRCVRLQDEPIPDGNCTYILNTDVKNGQGIHWISVVQQNKICYVFDSFGRKAQTLLKSFVINRMNRGYQIKNTDLTDQDQYGTRSVDCGHRTLSALMIYKKYGLNGYMQL